MSDLKAQPGQSLTADLWNRVIDRIELNSAGTAGLLGSLSASVVPVKNDSGTDRELGELLKLDTYEGPTDEKDISGNVLFHGDDVTWHTDIASAVVCAEPIPDGETGPCVVSGICLVKLDATGSDPFVMIDPTSTERCKLSDSGIARVLGVTGTYAIVSWQDGSRLWRYELTQASQAPSDTTAKLVDLSGADFASSLDLSDPESFMDDQSSGDTGFCIHVGNKFYAIQATCS